MTDSIDDLPSGIRAEASEGLSVGLVPRPGRRVRLTAAVVGVTLATLVAVMATRPSVLNQVAQSPLLHKPAPAISGPTLAGPAFDLSAIRGRFVVVNFFATWCVPCQREHPELVDFARRHAAMGDASVVSVVFQDDPAAVRSFFAEKGGDWPVVLDSDGRVAVDYGVTGIPESYVVDPDGRVAAKLIGGVTSRGLDKLVAGTAPAQAQDRLQP